MMSRIFLDTNVLIYSIDTRSPAKRRRARGILNSVQQTANVVVSTQVIQEFYVTATLKLQVAPIDVKGIINSMPPLDVVVVDLPLINQAIDCQILSRISFWDALIVVSAEKANCDTLLTEDLNDGQVIRGVRINNPFKDMKISPRGSVKESRTTYRTRKRKRTK